MIGAKIHCFLKLSFSKDFFFSKSVFLKAHFPKVSFLKIYFLKLHFPKPYFPKVSFPKVHYLKINYLNVYFQKMYFQKVFCPKYNFFAANFTRLSHLLSFCELVYRPPNFPSCHVHSGNRSAKRQSILWVGLMDLKTV